MFCRNVGGIDRAVRLAVGALLLPAGLVLLAGGQDHGLAVTVVGSLVLASGIFGFCPPYVLLGISTARPRGSAAPRAPTEGSGNR